MLESSPGRTAPAGVPVTAPPAWSAFRPLTVVDVVVESATVTSFVLAADEVLPGFEPGQFLTVRVPGASDPAPVRSYSLSGDAAGGRYRISVKRKPHGLVGAYLQTHLEPGDHIDVAAPRGGFVLAEGTDPVLLISAGIGLTPVLAMLHRLAGGRCTRDVWWIHTTHDATTHVFSAEADGLLAQLPSAHSVVYYTSPNEPLGAGSGIRSGRLTGEELAGLDLPTDAAAYVCGPESFMDDVTSSLGSIGLDRGQIHSERFGSQSPINPGVVKADRPPPHSPSEGPGTGPRVTFARSGLTAAWSEDYTSVLEFAEACDVPTQWSCRSGVCHTCVTGVLSGKASYDAPPLEPPGDDQVLICVARPATELVLDL
jgi:ferredoxin-NADP reductase